MPALSRSAPPTTTLVIGREIHLLIGNRTGCTAEEAAERGLVQRLKIEGIWLYAHPDVSIPEASQRVRTHGLQVCREWILALMHPLAGTIARDLDNGSAVTTQAARVLLRHFVRSGEMGALPALTNDNEPYLIVHDPRDNAVIARLISEARDGLAERGKLSSDELGDPGRPVTAKVWRSHILSHLEWCLLGSRTDRQLTAWDQL